MFVIYGRDGCAACRASKTALEKLEQDFEYVDIADEDGWARFREIFPYTNHIPQITYNEDQHIHGYNALLEFINENLVELNGE